MISSGKRQSKFRIALNKAFGLRHSNTEAKGGGLFGHPRRKVRKWLSMKSSILSFLIGAALFSHANLHAKDNAGSVDPERRAAADKLLLSLK